MDTQFIFIINLKWNYPNQEMRFPSRRLWIMQLEIWLKKFLCAWNNSLNVWGNVGFWVICILSFAFRMVYEIVQQTESHNWPEYNGLCIGWLSGFFSTCSELASHLIVSNLYIWCINYLYYLIIFFIFHFFSFFICFIFSFVSFFNLFHFCAGFIFILF